MVRIVLKVREVRLQKRLSVRDLSKMSGVSAGHISYIENGHKMPTIDVLVKIAKALEVRPEELYLIQ
jgi:transcriptional regulator with XRE-family HTH domain